jgi:hypothetical protein
LDQANSEIVNGGSGWSGNVTIAFTPPTIIGAASVDTFYGSWSNGIGIITLQPTSPNVQIGATIAAQGMPLNIVAGNVSGNLVTAVYSANGATVLTWLAAGNNLPVNFGYGILNGQGARTAVATVDIALSVTDFVVANIGRGYPENVSVSVANTTLSNTSGQSFANCQANVIIKGFGLNIYQGNASNGTLSIGSGYSANSVVNITFPQPQGGNSAS